MTSQVLVTAARDRAELRRSVAPEQSRASFAPCNQTSSMSETPLQDLNAAAGGTPSAADSPGIGLSSVSLSGVPDVEVKGNVSSQATPSTGVVRGIKDMSPEEVQAMNDKIRREAARKYFALRVSLFPIS